MMHALETRLERLEAESAVRRLVARYFRICDDLGPHTPFGELAELFTVDAIWEGKGRYKGAFGIYNGRDAIVDMIRSYCEPPHFSMTAHFLSSEDIQVDGPCAKGSWSMLQTSTYADGRADLRSAALQIECIHDRERWRIRHFETRNIFSRRVSFWNDEIAIPTPFLFGDGQ
jgi:hypothetical protein